VLDLGARWITDPDHNHLLSKLYQQYDVGEIVRYAGGKCERLPPLRASPEHHPAEFDGAFAVLHEMDRLATPLDLNKPWTFPDAARADTVLAEVWVKTSFPDLNPKSVNLVNAIFGGYPNSPAWFSPLHALFYGKNASSWASNVSLSRNQRGVRSARRACGAPVSLDPKRLERPGVSSTTELVTVTYDQTPASGAPGVLVTLVLPEQIGVDGVKADEIRKVLTRSLANYFGPRAGAARLSGQVLGRAPRYPGPYLVRHAPLLEPLWLRLRRADRPHSLGGERNIEQVLRADERRLSLRIVRRRRDSVPVLTSAEGALAARVRPR
jgi:hypothetical protein